MNVPIAGDSDGSGATGERAQRPGCAGAPRVLWIDDELRADSPEVQLLSHSGIEVDSAQSGGQGLALVDARLHDAVILDLRLPDMSGVDVLFRIRMQQCRIPVIVVTGWAEMATAIAVMRLGAADVLSKPVDADELAVALRMMLESARSPGRTAPGEPNGRILRALLDAVSAADSQRAIRLAVVRVLLHPDIGLRTFSSCAAMLRAVSIPDLPVAECQGTIRAAILEYARTAAAMPHPQVVAALDALEKSPGRRSEQDVASDLGIERCYLSKLVAKTGQPFREWRRDALVRAALAQLIVAKRRVAEVADGLGYSHPSMFDRDFRQVLAATPRALRSLWEDGSQP